MTPCRKNRNGSPWRTSTAMPSAWSRLTKWWCTTTLKMALMNGWITKRWRRPNKLDRAGVHPALQPAGQGRLRRGLPQARIPHVGAGERPLLRRQVHHRSAAGLHRRSGERRELPQCKHRCGFHSGERRRYLRV